jgi:hypothetical protein
VEILQATRSLSPRHRKKRLFAFTRKLRSRPELAGAWLGELIPLLRLWHNFGSVAGRSASWEAAWVDFSLFWEQVRQEEGQGEVEALFAKSAHRAVPRRLRTQPDNLRRLVAFASLLQERAGEGSIYLSCAVVGRLFGVHWATAARWLRVLVNNRVLRLDEAGDQKTGRCARYSYVWQED